jgi:hypothetical protein
VRNSDEEVKKEVQRRYGREADGTVENAVKHCAWMCYVATSRSCTESQALALGKAHEAGDNKKLDKGMDLFNNEVGARDGGSKAKGRSLNDCFDSCEIKAKLYWLYWYLPAPEGKPKRDLPKDFPCFTRIKDGNPIGAKGRGGCKPPDAAGNTPVKGD